LFENTEETVLASELAEPTPFRRSPDSQRWISSSPEGVVVVFSSVMMASKFSFCIED
jgi:hypothetical protein